jgi:hypothetical protein
LPSLTDVRTEYRHEANAELVYELCAALVREGLGTAETWKQSGDNALSFAQHAMMSAIGSERGDPARANSVIPFVNLVPCVVDDLLCLAFFEQESGMLRNDILGVCETAQVPAFHGKIAAFLTDYR